MGEFASFLKEIRLGSGYTQTQFAAKLGIDTAALSKIENGKKEFDSKKLEVLSKEFDIKLEDLKVKYFGEKIALELYENKCPVKVFKIAEEKYRCFEVNV
jgi:transcriptional regulator with XRE-family HTH domain